MTWNIGCCQESREAAAIKRSLILTEYERSNQQLQEVCQITSNKMEVMSQADNTLTEKFTK